MLERRAARRRPRRARATPSDKGLEPHTTVCTVARSATIWGRFRVLLRYYEGKRRRERPRVCKFCALERRGPYIIVRPRVFPVLGAAGPPFLPHAGPIFCLSGAAPSSSLRARSPPSGVSSDTTPTARASPTGVGRGSKRATGASLAGGHASVALAVSPSVRPGHRPPRPRACPGLAAWQVPSKAAAGCPVQQRHQRERESEESEG